MDLDVRNQAYQAITQLFDDKHDDFKMKVLETIVTTGVSVDDPIFILLAQVIPFRFTVEEIPTEIKSALSDWLERFSQIKPTTANDLERMKADLSQVLSSLNTPVTAEIQALKGNLNSLENKIESHLSHAVKENLVGINEQLPKNKQTINKLINYPILAGMLAITGLSALGVGWLLGSKAVALDPAGPRSLTLSEVELLNWAKSDRGRLGKQIVEWNGEYLLSGECEKDARALGVALSMNTRKATNGFCILWTKPYKQRNFK